jgi:hypothetical protein
MVMVLTDYNQFLGRHWETGSVSNYYAYRGVTAPHTGQPYSEALLLGVSGGIVMGYFSFAYEGYDSMANILTRNTFDPWDTMLGRLGVVQNVKQTGKPETGVKNLEERLEEGLPAIVWADMYSLPYNALPYDEGMWGMQPVVVYGYDRDNGQAWIADRSSAPLTVTSDELDAARARVKNAKNRLITLKPPDPGKLSAAVRKGIWDCIKLFTEAPPKGSKNNFGLAAYRWWSELLTNPKARLSWEKEFPAGRKMYSGLTWAFNHINTFGNDGHAERDLYAAFLDEASQILGKPALQQVAGQFQDSAWAWDDLSSALLPDHVAEFAETRRLMLRRHRLFLELGSAALEDIQQVNARLREIKAQVSANFPLDDAGVVAMREDISRYVMRIHDIEMEAIEALQSAMG